MTKTFTLDDAILYAFGELKSTKASTTAALVKEYHEMGQELENEMGSEIAEVNKLRKAIDKAMYTPSANFTDNLFARLERENQKK